MDDSTHGDDTKQGGDAQTPKIEVVDLTPGGAPRGLLELLLRGGLSKDLGQGDTLEGEPIELLPKPASVEQVLDFLASTKWQPVVGDIVEALPRSKNFIKFPAPGQRAIVTQVMTDDPLWGRAPTGTPMEAMPDTIALAFTAHPAQDPKREAQFIEHLFDHRLFRRVGTIFNEDDRKLMAAQPAPDNNDNE